MILCVAPIAVQALHAQQKDVSPPAKGKPAPAAAPAPAEKAKPAENATPAAAAESKAPAAGNNAAAAPKTKAATEAPNVFQINNPKITEAEIKEFKTNEFKFKIALQRGDLDRELIQQGIRTRVYSLTLLKGASPKEKEDGAKIVESLRREIYGAGLTLPEAGKRSFREFVLQEVTNRCAELLDNHFYPRLQAVVLLSSLNLIEPEPGAAATAAVGYTPVLDHLQKVLDEPGQLEPIKVVAVNGMTRINLTGSTPPSPNQRIRMAHSLIRELNNPQAHEWYQWRLVECLGSIDQVTDLNGQPFIVNTIQKTLNDRSRPWTVRSAAAKALGRAQLTPDMKVNVFVFEIVNLAKEAAEAVNAENAPKSPYWSHCFWDIYCAFKPEDSAEVARGVGLTKKIERQGMKVFDKTVTEGYKQILPLMNHAISSDIVNNFPDELMTPVRDWLQTNTPPNYKKPEAAPKQAADETRRNPG